MQLLTFSPAKQPAAPAPATVVGVTSADGAVTSTRPAHQAGAAAAAPAHPGLEALASKADALKASAAPAGPGAPGAPGAAAAPALPAIPNSEAVAHLVTAVRDTTCMVAGLEAPKRTLTDEKVKQLGGIWGTVLDHYGISLADKGGRYAPVLVAAMATVPLVRDCVMETRKEILVKDAAAKGKPPAAPAGPVTYTMTTRDAGGGKSKEQAAPSAPAVNPGFQEGVVKPAFATA